MPRRYHAYPAEFQVLNVLSSAGAWSSALGYLLPVIYLALVAHARAQMAGAESVGRHRARVDDAVAAADRELHRAADRDAKAYDTSTSTREMQSCLTHGRARRATATRHAHAHHPALQHHFDTMEQQQEAATLGMWVFLVTEVMFFGGLFLAYMLYRDLVLRGVRRGQPSSSTSASGGLNTVVLIGSC